jgi:SAM-dependent methyltransferase
MDERSHGYDVSLGYSYGFYREMAPDWLDLCVRAAGHEAPARGGSFRYLELGAGQGLGLCLLAAANSGAEFVGVDFQQEHVAHSRDLAKAAGLTNVRFVEADFADLAINWPDDFGTFDYVALHGIVSWVSPRLREAVVQCLSHGTHAGSLVYAGYNAQPSWLGTVPFQHITRLLKETTGGPGETVIDQSITLFERLRRANAIGFQLLPALEVRLQTLRTHSLSYCVHEYLNENWQPLWHSEIAREFGNADLHFAGSATVADNLLPEVLSQPLRTIVLEQQSEELRQDLQDFAINQGFRRDIFCRRPVRRSEIEFSDRTDTRLCLMTRPEPGSIINVQTSFGTMALEHRAYGDIIAALAEQPMPIRELIALPNPLKRDTRLILLLLLQAHIIDVVAAAPGAVEPAQSMNAAVARAVCNGAPYEHVAAAKLGSGIRLNQIELVMIDSWLDTQNTDVGALADAVSRRLRALGQKLYRDGRVVDDADATEQFHALARIFLQDVLPRWRWLGILA